MGSTMAPTTPLHVYQPLVEFSTHNSIGGEVGAISTTFNRLMQSTPSLTVNNLVASTELVMIHPMDGWMDGERTPPLPVISPKCNLCISNSPLPDIPVAFNLLGPLR